MRIFTVLRSGGEYTPAHVRALQKQIAQFAPLEEFVCLSDVAIPGVEVIPLEHNWPGWWSKQELYRPDIAGNILYLDLDTVIVGPLDDIVKTTKLTMLRDFYRTGVGYPQMLGARKEGLGSGMMFLPESDRAAVWKEWVVNPAQFMNQYFRTGDQAFLERHYLKSADRWQDVVLNQVISYKVHCLNKGQFCIPYDARVLCFHGQPRPFNLPQFKDLY